MLRKVASWFGCNNHTEFWLCLLKVMNIYLSEIRVVLQGSFHLGSL